MIKPSLIFVSLLCPIVSFGQEKLSVAAGFGFPELLNAGVRINGQQTQFGLSAGTWPAKDSKTFSISGDFYFHFGGHSKLTQRKPWFGKTGLNYFKSESEFIIERYTYFNVSIGREFNISEKFGLQISGGTVFELDSEITFKYPSGWDIAVTLPVLPSLTITTFYKVL